MLKKKQTTQADRTSQRPDAGVLPRFLLCAAAEAHDLSPYLKLRAARDSLDGKPKNLFGDV